MVPAYLTSLVNIGAKTEQSACPSRYMEQFVLDRVAVPSEIHPDALHAIDVLIRELGLPVSAADFIAWTSGERAIPAEIAITFYRRLRIPIESWRRIEGVQERAGAPIAAPSDMDPQTVHMKRSPPRSNPDHPFHVWLAGKKSSAHQWAGDKSLPASTVSAWVRGSRPIPKKWREAIAAESNDAVPDGSWTNRGD